VFFLIVSCTIYNYFIMAFFVLGQISDIWKRPARMLTCHRHEYPDKMTFHYFDEGMVGHLNQLIHFVKGVCFLLPNLAMFFQYLTGINVLTVTAVSVAIIGLPCFYFGWHLVLDVGLQAKHFPGRGADYTDGCLPRELFTVTAHVFCSARGMCDAGGGASAWVSGRCSACNNGDGNLCSNAGGTLLGILLHQRT
jgi:hypothetical protein